MASYTIALISSVFFYCYSNTLYKHIMQLWNFVLFSAILRFNDKVPFEYWLSDNWSGTNRVRLHLLWETMKERNINQGKTLTRHWHMLYICNYIYMWCIYTILSLTTVKKIHCQFWRFSSLHIVCEVYSLSNLELTFLFLNWWDCKRLLYR